MRYDHLQCYLYMFLNIKRNIQLSDLGRLDSSSFCNFEVLLAKL